MGTATGPVRLLACLCGAEWTSAAGDSSTLSCPRCDKRVRVGPAAARGAGLAPSTGGRPRKARRHGRGASPAQGPAPVGRPAPREHLLAAEAPVPPAASRREPAPVSRVGSDPPPAAARRRAAEVPKRPGRLARLGQLFSSPIPMLPDVDEQDQDDETDEVEQEDPNLEERLARTRQQVEQMLAAAKGRPRPPARPPGEAAPRMPKPTPARFVPPPPGPVVVEPRGPEQPEVWAGRTGEPSTRLGARVGGPNGNARVTREGVPVPAWAGRRAGGGKYTLPAGQGAERGVRMLVGALDVRRPGRDPGKGTIAVGQGMCRVPRTDRGAPRCGQVEQGWVWWPGDDELEQPRFPMCLDCYRHLREATQRTEVGWPPPAWSYDVDGPATYPG